MDSITRRRGDAEIFCAHRGAKPQSSSALAAKQFPDAMIESTLQGLRRIKTLAVAPCLCERLNFLALRVSASPRESFLGAA